MVEKSDSLAVMLSWVGGMLLSGSLPLGQGCNLQSIEAPVDIRTSHCCPSSQQFCESPSSPFYREDTAAQHDPFAGFHSQYSAIDSLPHLCSTVCLLGTILGASRRQSKDMNSEH